MLEIQPSLDLLVQGVLTEKFGLADVIGSYMLISRVPLLGVSLDQALNKSQGVIEAFEVGSIDEPAPDAYRIVESVASENRKILLLSLLSLCYFSAQARRRVHALAASFDNEIMKGST